MSVFTKQLNLSHGVMVARQILVLQVGVRVPVRQQNVLRVGIFYNTRPS